MSSPVEMLARQQAKGEEEEGKRRVGMLLNKGTLVPVWIVQNVVLLLYIGVLSWEAFYTSGRILAYVSPVVPSLHCRSPFAIPDYIQRILPADESFALTAKTS